jgi:phosphatidylglycerol:prolipoprotein diacylglycerol transferase
MSVQHGGLYFSIFYPVAFITGIFILIYDGYRKKYPLLPWILIIASSLVFLIIGSKLFTYSGEDWKFFIENFKLPATSGKTILGGVLAGIGFLIARWWLKFKLPALDSFAIAFPLCLAIMRVGCFLAGCCFGNPTNLPWGVKYPLNSEPYLIHLSRGWIDPLSDTSLAVHPTQLYEIIYCLAILMIILKIRRLLKAQGNLLFSAAVLYGCFRFASEFIRDSAEYGIAGNVIWGLKYIQWGILIFIVALSSIIFYREYSFHHKQIIPGSYSNNLYRNLVLMISLILIIFLGKNWFTPLELTVIFIIIIPGIAGVCWQVYKALTLPALRWIPVALVTVCMLFMGQTQPNDTIPRKIHYTINTGGSIGNYYNEIRYNPHELFDEDCISTDPPIMFYDRQIFRQKYYNAGIGVTRSEAYENYNLSYGVNIYGGQHKENKLDEIPVNEFLIFGINPNFRIDWRWVGIGSGLHLGNLSYSLVDLTRIEKTQITSGSKKLHFLPEFLFRIGPYDIIDAEFKYGSQYPCPYPGLQGQFSLGSGFGLTNGTSLRLGITYPTFSPLISGKAVIKERYECQLLFTLFPYKTPEGSTSKLYQTQFAFGLNYRFGFNEKPLIKKND